MCGIAGFVDFKGSSSKSILNEMTDALLHRGPDGSGAEVFTTAVAQVGLGHRRLSIIDLSETGRQPMSYKQFRITFNGEIYNYQEVKDELRAKQHAFAGHSDTEVILHAFEEWGVAAAHKFIGMFAFVIYDTAKNEVNCFRDRTGIKPFYYYWDGNLFLFASELKAFHKHPRFEKKINKDAFAAFAQYGNIPAPYAIYDKCHKLPPAHSLSLDLNTRAFTTKQYWSVYDYYNKPALSISYEEAKEQTEQLLNSAFQYRMVADVPVGVFLSGGYDSSCVTALLQKKSARPLKTFTISVPDIGLNEAPYAAQIAKYLGTEHHEFACTEKEAIALVKELPFFYDEPFGDSSAIPTSLLSRLTRKEVTVALSADGGDELFAGYNRYDYLMKYGKRLNATPGFVRKSLALFMQGISADKLPYFKNKYNFANRYEKVKQLLKAPGDYNIMHSLSTQYSQQEWQGLFNFVPNQLVSAYQSKALNTQNYTSLRYMMALDYETYLPDDILQKVDRATMSASLEGREPFLDHRLIEFVAQLPDDYKYLNGVKKRLLKDITHNHIPKHLLDRPKMGFAIPIEKWMRGALKEDLTYHLSAEVLSQHGLLNEKVVSKLLQDFLYGRSELGQKIWYLYMFQKWWEQWGNKRSV
jgi:asparagine synthase (glutamine-hydrolysing)